MLDKLDLPMAQLAETSTADLAAIQAHLNRTEAELKKRKETFAAVMLRRFGTAAQAAYTEAKKDTGTVNLAAPGSNLLNLKVEVDKTVVWEQDGTLKWLNSLPIDEAKHFGKIKVEIPEAKYAAATPAIQAKLNPLRTVKAGKMKFTFVSPAEAVAEAA